jgi:hypothetical protein
MNKYNCPPFSVCAGMLLKIQTADAHQHPTFDAYSIQERELCKGGLRHLPDPRPELHRTEWAHACIYGRADGRDVLLHRCTATCKPVLHATRQVLHVHFLV